jgi:hypothetical protein
MERVDFHVALELCEIVIESATQVRIVFRLSPLPIMSPHLDSAPLPSFLKLRRCPRSVAASPAALPSMSIASLPPFLIRMQRIL